MPLELQLIRAAEFLCLNASGRFDPKTSKVALAKIARACRKRGVERVMLDLRALQPERTPVFSPHDLADLVDTFHHFGFTKNLRLALLYTSDPHGRARMFSFIGLIRGWQVRGFGAFESAMLWLSDEPSEESAPEPGARRIPVQKRSLPQSTVTNAPRRNRSSPAQLVPIQTQVRL